MPDLDIFRLDLPPLTDYLDRFGFRPGQFQVLSIGSVGLCIGLWIRAKTVDQDERGNAERRALFVGLWPPLLWLIGDTLMRERERAGARRKRHQLLRGLR
jgi:hypothetical protein